MIFPSFQEDLELFTAEEVAKLKELGVLNPPNAPERPPLFPLLVSSRRVKVVSAALGMPPPDFDAHGIGQSLATDRDEESILSDSYSDHHSTTVDSSTLWGGLLYASQKENRNHGPLNTRTEIATSPVTKSVTEIVTGIVIGPKRAITNTVQIGPMDALHDAEIMVASASVTVSMRDRAGRRVHLTTTKQSRDVE